MHDNFVLTIVLKNKKIIWDSKAGWGSGTEGKRELKPWVLVLIVLGILDSEA